MLHVPVYFLISLVAYLFFVIGILKRKNKIAHAILMGTAIATDLAMVVILELQRNAIAEVIKGDIKPWLICHVTVSFLAVLLYIPVFILGFILLNKKGGKDYRNWHIRLGILSFILRTLGLFFLFLYLNS